MNLQFKIGNSHSKEKQGRKGNKQENPVLKIVKGCIKNFQKFMRLQKGIDPIVHWPFAVKKIRDAGTTRGQFLGEQIWNTRVGVNAPKVQAGISQWSKNLFIVSYKFYTILFEKDLTTLYFTNATLKCISPVAVRMCLPTRTLK